MNRLVLHALPYAMISLLVIADCSLVYLLKHAAQRPSGLEVSVLNIGQGDSILVRGPTGITMLVDGGPDRSVLRELSAELGPLQRHIDLIVETHPDADHISGLADVFQNYSVSYFMTPAIPDGTLTAKRIEAAAAREPHLKRLTARRGMRLDLGGGAYADVLYPDRDMSRETATNDGSVTMHVVYGRTSFLLTGDLPSPVEHWLVMLDKEDGELKSTVLKAGHHGSKYSTSEEWLSVVDPHTVAISAGLHNRYGHPNPETLARIGKQGAEILKTEVVGTLNFFSDGERVTEKSRKP